MDSKNILSFAEIGYNYIKFIIFNTKDEIIFCRESKLNFMFMRYKSLFEYPEIFEILILIINQAEVEHDLIISDVIFVTKEIGFNISNINLSIELKENEKIDIFHYKKILQQVITYHNDTNKDSTIIDVISNEYKLDNILVKNPTKMTGNLLTVNLNILGLSNIAIKNFETTLGKYKIRPKYFIPSSLALSEYYFTQEPNVMYIDFGTYATNYVIKNNNQVILYDNINLGGFDITNDLSMVLKLNLHEAEILKKSLNNNHNTKILTLELDNGETKYINVQNAFEVANARIEEIIKLIKKNIISNSVVINKVYISGGIVGNFYNLSEIISNILTKPVILLSETDNLSVKNKQIETINFKNLLGGYKFYSKAVNANLAKYNSSALISIFDVLRNIFY